MECCSMEDRRTDLAASVLISPPLCCCCCCFCLALVHLGKNWQLQHFSKTFKCFNLSDQKNNNKKTRRKHGQRLVTLLPLAEREYPALSLQSIRKTCSGKKAFGGQGAFPTSNCSQPGLWTRHVTAKLSRRRKSTTGKRENLYIWFWGELSL